MTTYEGETLGTAVAGISAYVDAKIGYEISVRELAWERIGKIAEEYGEVTEAWIGVGATNPRKGATHSYDDVRSELLDVAVAALGAWDAQAGNLLFSLALLLLASWLLISMFRPAVLVRL